MLANEEKMQSMKAACKGSIYYVTGTFIMVVRVSLVSSIGTLHGTRSQAVFRPGIIVPLGGQEPDHAIPCVMNAFMNKFD